MQPRGLPSAWYVPDTMDVLDGIANLPPQLLLIKFHLYQEKMSSETHTCATTPGHPTTWLQRGADQHYYVTDEVLAQGLIQFLRERSALWEGSSNNKIRKKFDKEKYETKQSNGKTDDERCQEEETEGVRTTGKKIKRILAAESSSTFTSSKGNRSWKMRLILAPPDSS